MRSPYITRAGYDTLCNELDYLLRVKRPEITRAVSEAAALGDRSENAEYIYGKKLLRETDRRIRFLQNRIPELTVVDQLPDDQQRIFFGATVCIEKPTGEISKLRIVGSDEIDTSQHWVSIDSPIAKALLGKRAGQDITFTLPNLETVEYLIVNIEYMALEASHF